MAASGLARMAARATLSSRTRQAQDVPGPEAPGPTAPGPRRNPRRGPGSRRRAPRPHDAAAAPARHDAEPVAIPKMRSESIDEAVSVRADFHGGRVTPVAFRRRGREHRVARVNARWVDRAGKHPRFYFSVTDENGDVYQLQLQGGDLLWWLDMVTLEG